MTQKIEGATVNTNDATGAKTVYLPQGATGATLKRISDASKKGKSKKEVTADNDLPADFKPGGPAAWTELAVSTHEKAQESILNNNPSPSTEEATDMASATTTKKQATAKNTAAKKGTASKKAGSKAAAKGAGKGAAKGAAKAAVKGTKKPDAAVAAKAAEPKGERKAGANQKLDYLKAMQIRHKIAEGQKRGAIAKEFDVDPFTIQAVAIGYTYPVKDGEKNPIKPAQLAELLKSNLPRQWKEKGIPAHVLKAAHLTEAPKA